MCRRGCGGDGDDVVDGGMVGHDVVDLGKTRRHQARLCCGRREATLTVVVGGCRSVLPHLARNRSHSILLWTCRRDMGTQTCIDICVDALDMYSRMFCTS